MLSAHIDHLGVGEPINGDKIYNGAMDNASGSRACSTSPPRCKIADEAQALGAVLSG